MCNVYLINHLTLTINEDFPIYYIKALLLEYSDDAIKCFSKEVIKSKDRIKRLKFIEI